MNRHFEDAQYHLKRAGEHTKAGVKEEFEGIQKKVNELRGIEEEPEPTRVEKIQADLRESKKKAEGKVKTNAAEARKKIGGYRKQRA
ncbi:DUF7553 family protein [Haloarchaeobius sp. DFWS5]|uniref:DUF7553 family protein n=1 Tax=Haloarchaeobius sp. DFWS5 TaxID=3446114 RepID=UPI003EBA03C4